MTLKYFPCAAILALIVTFAMGSLFLAKAQTISININVEREQVTFKLQDKARDIRVEVYSPGGELVFDSRDSSGETVVWNLQDRNGEPVTDGVYLAALSVTTDPGKVIKRIEQVIIARREQGEQQVIIAPAAEGNKVDGSGTPGKLPKWIATTTIGDSVINESVNKIGIGIIPTGVLHIDEAQPASSASNGTAATPLLQLSGGKGGDTTGVSVTAGAGADVSLFAGDGGRAPAGSANGKGGNILLQPGSPGAGAGAAGEPGKLLLAPLGGNVGIGTLSPSSKLTVFGRIEANNPGNGTGVLGQSDTGSGLRGVSTSGSGVLATSVTGIGVQGISTSFVGVRGFSDSEEGVLGQSISGAGLRGSSDSGIAVIGHSNTGLAGAFLGNVGISGHLGVGGASVAGSTLEVAGDVHSTVGFKFPDGSLQTTAGLAAVTHNGTLAGLGTPGAPLTVAILGITNDQLANGAVTGAKISVPLALSGSNASPILSVTNLGGGAAIHAAGAINSSAGYNIGGNRVMSIGGAGNLFVGPDAGSSNTTGGFNSFFGTGAGLRNTTGSENSFFGVDAGWGNTEGSFNSFFGKFAGVNNNTGGENSFFGSKAGYSNTTAIDNSFFGSNVGYNNTTGSFNSFFGSSAGFSHTTGGDNSFFGVGAGFSTTIGSNNSFFGSSAGDSNTTGGLNSSFGTHAGNHNTTGSNSSFFGSFAGQSNTTEDNNTFIGSLSNGATGITNATAIGYRAQVGQSNSLVLGSINGVNAATANTNVGIGTTTPAARLHISGTGVVRARVNSDSNAGLALTLGNQPKWSVATAAGGQFLIFNDAIGQNAFSIDVATNFVGINALAAGSTQLCRNASNQIANCSSSLRYKTNLATLHTGLRLINRLRPVTFAWKQSGEHDLGLVAEEVANVEPLLVTHNAKGEVEGVKYDRLGVVLINAVKEQQRQIESQQRQIDEQKELIKKQQAAIDALKILVCSQNQRAAICKPKL